MTKPWFNALLLLLPSWALAHDPIFGLGPHVLYKGGVELAAEWHGEPDSNESGLEITYGMTGDWALGAEIPLDGGDAGDSDLFSKYRFWRSDSLGVQKSAAWLLRYDGDRRTPAWVHGLAWGYESRRYYGWASIRYRLPQENGQDLKPGDAWRLDLVTGIRPWLTDYLEPDTVFMLELNGEGSQRARLEGTTLARSGGRRWFLSPGIFWTLRNFAIKAGVQIPLSQRMNDPSLELDYRARLTLEWHY